MRIAFFRNDYLRLSYRNYLCETAQVEWLLFFTSPEITFNTTHPKHHCRAAPRTESWDQMSKACCNSAAKTRDTIKLLQLGKCSQKSVTTQTSLETGWPQHWQHDSPCFGQSTLKAFFKLLRNLWWDGKGDGNTTTHNSCSTIQHSAFPAEQAWLRTSSDQGTDLA